MDAVTVKWALSSGRPLSSTAGRRRPGRCTKLVVFANAVEDNPFMAGAFHGVGEPECVINVGVSGPGVVVPCPSGTGQGPALRRGGGDHQDARLSASPVWASWLHRTLASAALGRSLRHCGSVAGAHASGHGRQRCPDPGRKWALEMAAARPAPPRPLRMLNDAVKKGGVMASGHVGGLSRRIHPRQPRTPGMIAAATVSGR